MPIAKVRHTEVRADGKPVFIIRPLLRSDDGLSFTNRVNTKFKGKRMGITFMNGVGRTVYQERAQELMEVNGYLVELPEGHAGFDIQVKRDRKGRELVEPEPDYVIEDELEEDDPEDEDEEADEDLIG